MIARARRHLPYSEARRQIYEADILLWRPTTPTGRLIATGTQGEYSHAGMAAWFGDVLLQLETLQFHGGRAANLSWQVARFPAACDVYRLPVTNICSAGHHMVRLAATRAMMRRTGMPYGWLDLVHAAARLVAPWACHHDAQHTAPLTHPLFCSGAVTDSLRRAGYEILPKSPVWAVAPSDLATVADYQFTLDWE